MEIVATKPKENNNDRNNPYVVVNGFHISQILALLHAKTKLTVSRLTNSYDLFTSSGIWANFSTKNLNHSHCRRNAMSGKCMNMGKNIKLLLFWRQLLLNLKSDSMTKIDSSPLNNYKSNLGGRSQACRKGCIHQRIFSGGKILCMTWA